MSLPSFMERKKMLRNSWRESLQEIMNRLHRHNPYPRIGIVGIGNEMRGDDFVGSYLARRLAPNLEERENILIVDAGPAPENCTHILRQFKPEFVILIDAAEMEKEPGSIQWIPWQDTIGFSASTHSLPLQIFAKYLSQELCCEIYLLGIQPLDTNLDTGLTPAVQDTAENVISEMTVLFTTPLYPSTTKKGYNQYYQDSSKYRTTNNMARSKCDHDITYPS
jgi:hydrogenase 3 maturation protease